ncbi:hypothetical protein CGZ75_12990 [Paenibacillus herberti]|uniref:Uncharacterized protein n=1 Tax=Paenibacillus herberti TaxID=1619309 RepID=A0A229NVP2_9BACL|nr:hypothetical protein CGZ75_12990 [Paenibacillus herberti]
MKTSSWIGFYGIDTRLLEKPNAYNAKTILTANRSLQGWFFCLALEMQQPLIIRRLVQSWR